MSEWAACYTVDGPHAGRVYHYGTANKHLLIVGGFVWSYYVITDETVDTPGGPVPAAEYYGTEPPPGAEPSRPIRRQPDLTPRAICPDLPRCSRDGGVGWSFVLGTR